VARFRKLDVLAHTVGGFSGGQSIVDTDDATFQRMFDTCTIVQNDTRVINAKGEGLLTPRGASC